MRITERRRAGAPVLAMPVMPPLASGDGGHAARCGRRLTWCCPHLASVAIRAPESGSQTRVRPSGARGLAALSSTAQQARAGPRLRIAEGSHGEDSEDGSNASRAPGFGGHTRLPAQSKDTSAPQPFTLVLAVDRGAVCVRAGYTFKAGSSGECSAADRRHRHPTSPAATRCRGALYADLPCGAGGGDEAER